MKTPPKFVPERLLEHESGVRAMVASARGEQYVALRSLSEAQAVPDGVVILEGDDGGQIYIVARAAIVRCSDDELCHLLSDLDANAWRAPTLRVFISSAVPLGRACRVGWGAAG